eukprot:m.45993 g.45993  ORF g.45993 m.45993 type:complete len:539 (+) comp13111_c0_seq1:120-1736(+)
MHWLTFFAAVCLVHTASSAVWPLPKTYNVSNTTTTFAADFDVKIPGKDLEAQVATTFTTWIQSVLPNTTASSAVTGVDVVVTKPLSFPYSYLEFGNYSIVKQANSSRLTISASTTLGAIHALSTLLQLAADNACPTTMVVVDEPDFEFRGLNLDVSSRWLPLNALEAIIDGLSLSKLNVLNLRLSDDEAVRFRSANSSKDLTDYANAFYTQSNIQDLVNYAAVRGVVVIPEFNLPVNAAGYHHASVDYCDDTKQSLRDTADTLDAVTPLLADAGKTFQQSIISIVGVDPSAVVNESCVNASLAAIIANVTSPQGYVKRRAMHWQREANTTKTDLLMRPFANLTNETLPLQFIFSTPNPSDLAFPSKDQSGFGDYQQYLKSPCQGAQATLSLRSMCSSTACGVDIQNSTKPELAFMAKRSQDNVAATAVLNALFPGLTGLAGGLWNAANVTDKEVTAAIMAQAKVLAAYKVSNCTCGTCTLSTSCSGKYVEAKQDIPLMKFGFVFGIAVASAVLLAVIVVQVRYNARKSDGEYTPLLNY